MISQIDIEKTLRQQPNAECMFVGLASVVNNVVDKVNQLVKTVNEIKQYLDWDEISGEKPAENCKCAKNAQKSYLEEALEGFPGLFKSNKDEPLVEDVKENFTTEPITLIDMFNEMGRLYAALWNKLEDIHHELKKEQQ